MKAAPGLVVAGGAVLLTLTLVVAFSLRALGRQERWRARVVAVAGPFWPAGIAEGAKRDPLGAFSDAALTARLAGLFGLRLERASEYPVRWWLVPLVALPLARAATGVAAVVAGDLVLFTVPVVWVLFCRFAYGWMDERRRQILFRQFPDALGLVTRAVRVGIPVTEAIRVVAREAPPETAAEFRQIGDRLSIGLPLDRALAETAHRNGVPEYRFFATALSLQAQTGGGLAETLDNLAEVIRKRVALRERGHALASEARTSATVLAILPFFAMGALAVFNPEYLGVLFYEPSGQQILAIAAGLLVLGVLIMRTMIQRSLS